MILADKVLMVEPKNFTINLQTGHDNFFQAQGAIKAPAEASNREFQDLKIKLMKAGITVLVFSPKNSDASPDSVFPNNWVSTTPAGELILYPMMAENRRSERNKEIIDQLTKKYGALIDLSSLEKKNQFLEGTGSLVIDHEKKVVYASLSKRTTEEAVLEWSKKKKFNPVIFTSSDTNNQLIYHTNVMMTLGDGFAIVCLDAINEKEKREEVRNLLTKDRELFEITKEQMHSFCGNCLSLQNASGEKFLVMSSTAYNAFTENQKYKLIKYATILYSPLPTIESIGGGSARCMLAELF